ncbi:MAG: hypothetical protein ACRCX2_13210 [Paraclostridium sp.]
MLKLKDRVKLTRLNEEQQDKFDEEIGEVEFQDEYTEIEAIGSIVKIEDGVYKVKFADGKEAWFPEWGIEKAIDADLIEIDVVVTNCCERCSYLKNETCLIWNIDVCWDNVCSKFDEA